MTTLSDLRALLSPYAPLWPWLVPHRESRIPGILYRIFPETCRPLTEKDIGTPSDRLVDGIDLRDLPTRAVVLRALASIGHPRPWALGEGFGSDLTAEQAGRVVAEMVRRVGADPEKPVGVVPVAVVNAWRDPLRSGGWSNRFYAAGPRMPSPYSFTVDDTSWWVQFGRSQQVAGDVGGEAGRRACDLAASSVGLLLWEQVTP